MNAYKEKMIREMKMRNFAEGTQKVYLRAVEMVIDHFGRPPEAISSDEIKAFLLKYKEERNLSMSSFVNYVSGLKFLINVTLNRKEDPFVVDKIRKEKTLPVVLTRQEVKKVLACTSNLKHRTLLMVAYSSGLRVGELVKLRIQDIDSKRMVIRVEAGKLLKDRYTILTKACLEQLRIYWRKYRPTSYLFYRQSKEESVGIAMAQHAFKRAYRKSGLKKKAHFHTLRHCFATHLLEAGVDLRTIQIMMGHSNIQSTAEYLKVSTKQITAAGTRVDLLKFF